MNHLATCVACLSILIGPRFAVGQDLLRTELSRPPARAQPAPVAPEPDRIHIATLVPSELPSESEPMLDYAAAAAREGASARFRGSLVQLAFASGDWQPPPGERIDPDLQRLASARGSHEWVYGFVILAGQDTPIRLNALRAAGAEPIEFHPYSAYKVRLRPGCERAVADLPFVRWVGFARRAQRVSPELGRILAGENAPKMVSGGKPGTLALYVTVFDSDKTPKSERFLLGAGGSEPLSQSTQWLTERPWRVRSNGPHEAAIAATGVEVAGYYDDSKCFLVHATLPQVSALLDLDRVHYIEVARAAVPDHDQSMPCTSQDEVRGLYPGGGEVVAGIIDSGVDRNHTDTSFFGQGWDLTGDDTPWTDIDGHGTHVAGTILGRGSSKPAYKGAAAGLGWDASHRFLNARLYRGDASAWGSALDAFNYMAQGGGGTAKAMVVNASWHTSTDGLGTDAVSVDADAKAYAHGILWVVAAGNRSNASTINDPASAKNVLAVANVQDEDGAVVNGNYVVYGAAAVGLRANTSSQGPAADGRWKPNLAAPGRTITSVQAGTASSYVGLSGTSMAAPHVTGIAAGLMQHYPALQRSPHFLGAKLMANAINRSGAFVEDRAQFGFGKVNAYRSHWSSDAPGGWVGGSGAVDVQSGVGATVDSRPVPDDCTWIYLVTWHLESAASTGAGNAVKNNVDVYVDRPPYTAGTNTGEYLSNNVLNNCETLILDGSVLQGQVLRLKFHPTSIRAGETVKVGFQYCMLRGSRTPTATTSLTSNKLYVQPSSTFRLTGELGCDSFFAANTLARLRDLPVGFQLQNLHLYLGDGTLVERLMPQTMFQTLGDVRYDRARQVFFDVKAPPSDFANAQFRASFWASNVAGGAEQIARSPAICVDGSAPSAVGNLSSSTHPADAWTNATRFTAVWVHSTDVGCAGVDGYSWKYALGSAPTPDSTVDEVGNSLTFDVVASDQAHYFAVRALDRAGNLSTVRTHRFYVDTSIPVFASFTMAGGITHTRSRLVSMDLTATDTYSGVSEMRFSNDGATWSPWMQYQAQVVNWDLITGAGGSDTRGVRTIWGEVRDKAGNSPARRTVKVTWDDVPPGGEIRLANGAPFTLTPVVTITLAFQDQHSALARMRFSNDGVNWAAWEGFATTRPSWDLTLYGGGTGLGQKTVHCEVEDAATNRSAPVSARIQWIGKPSLAAVMPSSTVTLRYPEEGIRLSGTNHDFLTEAVLRKGTQTVLVPLGSDWDVRGRLVDPVSATESLLYLPKPIEPGTWNVALRNPAGESLALPLLLDLPPATSPVLDLPPSVRIADPRGVSVVVVAASPLDRGVLLVSTQPRPSVLQGIVALEIGDNFTALVDLGAYRVDPVTRAFTLRLPSPSSSSNVGVRLYFEAALTNGVGFPLPTTNFGGVVVVP